MVTSVRLVREIKIGSRVRTDDSAEIDSLAKSIKETGLRHAITIDPDNNLIAGWRRLKSYQRLGWKQIEVNVAHNMDSVAVYLGLERDDDTETAEMSDADLLAFVAAIDVLTEPDGRSRKSRAIAEGNRRRHRGEGAAPRLSWKERAPNEPRTVIGNAIGLSGATTSRLQGIARRMRSDDPVVRDAAILAQQDIQAGIAIHPAYEKMTASIRLIKHPDRVRPEPEPVPEEESPTAVAYRLRRREEMVAAKFQREIIGAALTNAAGLVGVLTHIADKLGTYGVNEEITSEEQERWLKDIARTRSALLKVSRAIKGGQENGSTETD